jgi:O-antigen/teichoic acid export membrane protein
MAGALAIVFTTGNVTASQALLVLTGKERSFAKITAPHAALNLVLCAALIGPLGINGAALGAAIVMVSWQITLTVYARRRLGIRSYPRFRTSRTG